MSARTLQLRKRMQTFFTFVVSLVLIATTLVTQTPPKAYAQQDGPENIQTQSDQDNEGSVLAASDQVTCLTIVGVCWYWWGVSAIVAAMLSYTIKRNREEEFV